MKNYFAENLKSLRLKYKYSQPDLADKLRVSKAMISFWENGKYEPTATNIINIANFFDISIDDLLTQLL